MMVRIFMALFILSMASSASAAIAYRAVAGANNSSTNSLTITKPTGTVNNDVMLAIINVNGSTTITAPDGWSLVRSINTTVTATIAVYRKAASSEGSDYTFSFSGTQRNAGAIISFSGVNTSSQIDVENGQAEGNLGTQVATAPGVTTTVADTMLVYLSSFDDVTARTYTEPSGMTEVIDQNVGSGCTIAYVAQASTGATGDKVGTLSSNNTTRASFLVALNPDTGGGSTLKKGAVMVVD